jgi:ankyrin repeat protein
MHSYPVLQLGWTALHLAAGKGNLKVVAELLEAGANLDAMDKVGATPATRTPSPWH